MSFQQEQMSGFHTHYPSKTFEIFVVMFQNYAQLVITMELQTRNVFTQAQMIEKRFNIFHYDLFPVEYYTFFNVFSYVSRWTVAILTFYSPGLWAPRNKTQKYARHTPGVSPVATLSTNHIRGPSSDQVGPSFAPAQYLLDQ